MSGTGNPPLLYYSPEEGFEERAKFGSFLSKARSSVLDATSLMRVVANMYERKKY